MSRRAYIALAWPPGVRTHHERAEALGQRIEAEGGWAQAGGLEGLSLWTSARNPLPVRPLPRAAGFLVGDIHASPGATGPLWKDDVAAPDQPEAVARRLARTIWGQYVALLQGPPPARTAVFRDPTGQLGAFTWRLDEALMVIASDLASAPAWLRPPRLALDWSRIRRFLVLPGAATSDALFEGMTAVPPGELASAAGETRGRRIIWAPGDFIPSAPVDLQDARDELVRRVDACTAAMAAAHDRVLVEVSGGLDSAVVAGSLEATGVAGRVAAWINLVGDRRESDETAYAVAVAERLGVALTRIPRHPSPLVEADLRELAPNTWPTMASIDASRDRDELALVRATGATAILSGEGGDAAFFQMPTALVAGDAFRRRGPAILGSPLLADVARRTRQSVFAVLREVAADLRGRARLPDIASPYVVAAGRDTTALAHPWVQDARRRGVTGAKTLQVMALSTGHLFQTESRRRAEADLLYPLFAQPVMEHCLSIPADDLAGASYDRPFARAAFAHRIPAAVFHRRGKGDHSAYYARTVALSLDMLRPYLLDGCLCGAGVLDRAALDRALTPDRLVWGESPTAILWAASVEAWVRYWQGRVPDSPRAPRSPT